LLAPEEGRYLFDVNDLGRDSVIASEAGPIQVARQTQQVGIIFEVGGEHVFQLTLLLLSNNETLWQSLLFGWNFSIGCFVFKSHGLLSV